MYSQESKCGESSHKISTQLLPVEKDISGKSPTGKSCKLAGKQINSQLLENYCNTQLAVIQQDYITVESEHVEIESECILIYHSLLNSQTWTSGQRPCSVATCKHRNS